MTRHYCKHCNERIRQRDGRWTQTNAPEHVDQNICRNNTQGHEPR